MYRIRIDIKSDLQPITFLDSKDTYVIVHHVLPHGNPHYHLFYQPYHEVKINALRQRIKRFFNVQSDEYSVKQCDPNRVNEYIQYLFNRKHDNTPTLISHNISQDIIDEAMKQAQTVHQEFANRHSDKPKKSKTTIYTMAEEIYQLATQEIVSSSNYIEGYSGFRNLSPQYYVPIYTRYAIQVLHQNRQAFDYFYLRKIVCTAMSMDKQNHAEIEKRVLKFFLE